MLCQEKVRVTFKLDLLGPLQFNVGGIIKMILNESEPNNKATRK